MTTTTMTNEAVLERFPKGRELARKSGLAESTVSRIFSQDPESWRWPEEQTARALARALDISVAQVYEMVELRRRPR